MHWPHIQKHFSQSYRKKYASMTCILLLQSCFTCNYIFYLYFESVNSYKGAPDHSPCVGSSDAQADSRTLPTGDFAATYFSHASTQILVNCDRFLLKLLLFTFINIFMLPSSLRTHTHGFYFSPRKFFSRARFSLVFFGNGFTLLFWPEIFEIYTATVLIIILGKKNKVKSLPKITG